MINAQRLAALAPAIVLIIFVAVFSFTSIGGFCVAPPGSACA